ncbi:MAG: MATE family efflux transporter, partial [Candidatus Limivivens sp.]|nr:MATE family efflux transporter [Candidatus Limivivens sp.]
KKLADTTATLGLFFNILHSFLIGMLCIIGMPAFLGRFSSDPEILRLGTQYARIVFLFAIPNGAGVSYEKMFQAIGRMKVSMVSMLVGCIVNIILDPLMIFGFGPLPAMGIEGAAWATGTGQVVSLVIYLAVYFKDSDNIPVKISMKNLQDSGKTLKKIYGIGIPASLNLALPSFMIMVLNGILAAYSASYVLVLGAYYKLQTFIYLTGNGIVQGMRPICGYNYGAGEYKRVKAIFKAGLELISMVMLAGTVLCLLIPDRLIGIFTSNQETVVLGKEALLIICRGFILSGVSVTISGVFEGLGKGVESLLISLIRYLVVLLPLAFLFSRFQGAAGVWQAFWVTELVAAVLSIVLFGRVMEKISREKR